MGRPELHGVGAGELCAPLILACLRRESETLAALRESGGFVVNLLGARRRRDVGGGRRSEQDGVPVLDGALTTLGCRVHEQPDGGDHVTSCRLDLAA
ncbi:MAG TPA: flavin reductase family protein [Solirubrobacteraceae bacterium]|nr:flavin reductase family protein [Solirubrobacteraceae bacterium]